MVVGHATHFLQRLDRVSDGHVELALTLYRDEELLREALSCAAVPEGAERVAISLDDPIEGPFVVVTRGGRFVTCLAAGMLVSDLPIVTRERLDTAAKRVGRMREELDRVRALRESGAEGQASIAFRRMQQQGPRFAREDAERLLEVQPLIERDCLLRFRRVKQLLDQDARKLAASVAGTRKMPTAHREYLLAFGDAVWTLAHLLVLLSSSAMRANLERIEDEDESSLVDWLAQSTYEWGTFIHVTRALWFVARGGKRALASVKAIPSTRWVSERLYRELALTSIALSSEKLRAEAMKALSTRAAPEGDVRASLVERFAKLGHAVAGDPAEPEASYLWASREYAAGARARQDGRPEVDLDRTAVPEDVARIAYLVSQDSIHRPEALSQLFVAMYGLPALVRASPAELFPPAAWAPALLDERGLDDVLFWFRPYANARCLLARPRTVRAEASPGRNDPCPCGSGKKYKRCCAGA